MFFAVDVILVLLFWSCCCCFILPVLDVGIILVVVVFFSCNRRKKPQTCVKEYNPINPGGKTFRNKMHARRVFHVYDVRGSAQIKAQIKAAQIKA